jgi:hypothetical protein
MFLKTELEATWQKLEWTDSFRAQIKTESILFLPNLLPLYYQELPQYNNISENSGKRSEACIREGCAFRSSRMCPHVTDTWWVAGRRRNPKGRPSGYGGGRGSSRPLLATFGAGEAAGGSRLQAQMPCLHRRRRSHYQEQADLHEEENKEGTEVACHHDLGTVWLGENARENFRDFSIFCCQTRLKSLSIYRTTDACRSAFNYPQ